MIYLWSAGGHNVFCLIKDTRWNLKTSVCRGLAFGGQSSRALPVLLHVQPCKRNTLSLEQVISCKYRYVKALRNLLHGRVPRYVVTTLQDINNSNKRKLF